jgi:FkbH-like protein
MPTDDRAIAISATFTAEAIEAALAFWAAELALPHQIRFAGYNQLFQELLAPASLFARNRGFNVALIRLDDWLAAGVDESARRFIDAVKQTTAATPLILALCPPAPGHEAACAPAARFIREALAPDRDDIPAVYLADPEPVANPHDPYAGELGHLPYTPLFFVSLATAIARKIHALSHPPYKAIALDCDDTLWRGICGEDGPQGVALDPPRRALQEFMAARRHDGMLLAMCSKNNEEDVLETFRAHPEMPLRLEDFAARRINWQSKGANLASLADELELGLDSFILVDDNPKECTEAQTEAPTILALPLPPQAEEIPEFLRHVWAFDRARVTQEDRRRHEQYAQRAQRATAAQSASSIEEFLESLQLDVRIEPMTPSQIPRVAQLTTRTNQMNMSSVRRTEGEIAQIRALDAECLTVHVSDRFGDYGLTGVVIFECASDTLTVDTFLLSCRALGRGVEHRMLAHLGEIAQQRGLARVEIPFVPSPRNRPAALFLESIGGGSLSAQQAAAVRYQPGQGTHHLPQEDARKRQAGRPVLHEYPAPASRPNYVKIATELRTPESVLARIHCEPRRVPTSHPPHTPLERDLAELWAALLNVSAVGLYDNFFDLGGHSLLAVQLLSRVRQIHEVDLSLELVYSGDFTVYALAQAIEMKEAIKQVEPEFESLLREIEDLSDEEAAALLMEERDE